CCCEEFRSSGHYYHRAIGNREKDRAMAQSQLGLVFRHVRSIATAGSTEGQNDEALFRAFAESKDQRAFTALVKRHGPMVLSVVPDVLAAGVFGLGFSQPTLSRWASDSGLTPLIHLAPTHAVGPILSRATLRRFASEKRSRERTSNARCHTDRLMVADKPVL